MKKVKKILNILIGSSSFASFIVSASCTSVKNNDTSKGSKTPKEDNESSKTPQEESKDIQAKQDTSSENNNLKIKEILGPKLSKLVASKYTIKTFQPPLIMIYFAKKDEMVSTYLSKPIEGKEVVFDAKYNTEKVDDAIMQYEGTVKDNPNQKVQVSIFGSLNDENKNNHESEKLPESIKFEVNESAENILRENEVLEIPFIGKIDDYLKGKLQVNEKNQYLEYTALITKVVQWDEKAYLVANVIVKNAKGEKKIFTLSIGQKPVLKQVYSSETINDVIEVDLNEIENDINENEAFISSLKNDDIYKIQVAAFISNFKANKNSFLGSSNESKQARKQLLDSWINFKKTYFNILNENNLGTSEMQEEIDKSKQILNKLIQLANMTQGILDKFESRINDLGTKYSTFINDPTKTVDELKEFTKTFKESVDELEKEFNKEISKSTSNMPRNN
ncbi:hypothetical protein RRG53_03220 [Mycoplasmopsis cynos]|nr:hypothetical protein [Mycoplasmopsis cynos]WQQ18289.1 hypothetical protein RRG53_03220 [Mycoplasmopsis cynos]